MRNKINTLTLILSMMIASGCCSSTKQPISSPKQSSSSDIQEDIDLFYLPPHLTFWRRPDSQDVLKQGLHVKIYKPELPDLGEIEMIESINDFTEEPIEINSRCIAVISWKGNYCEVYSKLECGIVNGKSVRYGAKFINLLKDSILPALEGIHKANTRVIKRTDQVLETTPKSTNTGTNDATSKK